MIDKKYYEANLAIYFADLLGSLAILVVAFLVCLYTPWPLVIVPYLIACIYLYRAAAFIHELTHQSRNPRMRPFHVLWNLTAGAAGLVAGVRFFNPHLTHHKTGIFGTKEDPQYPLLRQNRVFMVFGMLILPFFLPLLSLVQVVTSSLNYFGMDEALERYLVSKGYCTGGVLPQAYRRDTVIYGRYYLVLFGLCVWYVPQLLPLIYAIQVGAWMLTSWRVPLEHALRDLKESSVQADQMADSYTVENPISMLLQPLGLRFHTAHHMYPGVPYHNLRTLHEELKRTVPGYADQVIPLWGAIQGPGRETKA